MRRIRRTYRLQNLRRIAIPIILRILRAKNKTHHEKNLPPDSSDTCIFRVQTG